MAWHGHMHGAGLAGRSASRAQTLAEWEEEKGEREARVVPKMPRANERWLGGSMNPLWWEWEVEEEGEEGKCSPSP